LHSLKKDQNEIHVRLKVFPLLICFVLVPCYRFYLQVTEKLNLLDDQSLEPCILMKIQRDSLPPVFPLNITDVTTFNKGS
jgi:hypothetical protein